VQGIASYPKITVTVGGRGVCAATFKHGFGYHPLLAWLDNTREALAGDAAARNANANTAADQITVIDEALAQIPDEHRCGTPILICANGATKAWLAHLRSLREQRGLQLEFSVRFTLTNQLKDAIGPAAGDGVDGRGRRRRRTGQSMSRGSRSRRSPS
jgi:hypothetical protein